MTHDEAVLLGILSTVPQRFVLRTMMVKLTYMLDVYACEHTGDQVTGFSYSWDNYGPNDQIRSSRFSTTWLMKDSSPMSSSTTCMTMLAMFTA